jgi:hypothetical protein
MAFRVDEQVRGNMVPWALDEAIAYGGDVSCSEDYTWRELMELSRLHDRLEDLLDEIPRVGANNYLLLEDPRTAPLGQRCRPSALAERAMNGSV